jgi:hypothetical protein
VSARRFLTLSALACAACAAPAAPPLETPPTAVPERRPPEARPIAVAQAEPAPLAAVPPVLAGPVKLPPPPFTYTLVEPAKVQSSGRRLKLVRVSATGNAITDVEQWFARNKLPIVDAVRGLPPDVPAQVGRAVLAKAIAQADGHSFLFYRVDGLTRILVLLDPQRRLVEMFDFEAYAAPTAAAVSGMAQSVTMGPQAAPNPGAQSAPYATQDLQWAAYEGGVLYVSHHHLTYSKSSGGLNGFVTAIDVAQKKMLWRSETLTSNAESFVLLDGHVITGYGFTEEPDFLYVLDQATGKAVSKVPVNSRAEYLVLKDGKLYVRTYDTNYVFEPRLEVK